MNHPQNIFKFTLLNLIALAVAVIFWPYALAGLFASAISRMKYHYWVSSSVALVLVVAWRIIWGEWHITIGSWNPEHWYFEPLPGIVSWAFADIFVSAFAQCPAEFLKGYRSKLSILQQPSP